MSENTPRTPSASSPATREAAISRFGESFIGAMDEIAELLFASRLLVDATDEFQQLGAYNETKASLAKIEPVLSAVLSDLLNTLRLGPREDMEKRLLHTRKSNVLRLAEAGRIAAELVALSGQAGSEEVLDDETSLPASLQLQHAIERVAAAWATL